MNKEEMIVRVAEIMTSLPETILGYNGEVVEKTTYGQIYGKRFFNDLAKHLIDNGVRTAEGFEGYKHIVKTFPEEYYYGVKPITYKENSNDVVPKTTLKGE